MASNKEITELRRQLEEAKSLNEALRQENQLLEMACREVRDASTGKDQLSERLDAILHASRDHIFVCSPIGKFTHVGKHAAIAHGFEPAQMIGKDWRELGVADDIADKLDALRQEALDRREPISGQTDLPSADGLKPYEYVLIPLLSQQAERNDELICVAKDLSEQLRIRELEDLFFSLLKNIRAAAFVLDPVSSEIVLFNERACKIYRQDCVDMTGQKLIDISSIVSDINEWRELVLHVRSARFVSYETQESKGIGDIFPVEVDVSLAGNQDDEYLMFFIRDIRLEKQLQKVETSAKEELERKLEEQTSGLRKINELLRNEISERRTVESKLLEKRKQLRKITDALPVLISYIDSSERYQFNNKAYEKWFDFRVNEIKGMSVKQVVGEEAYRLMDRHIAAALQGKEVLFEEKIPLGNGEFKWARVHYLPDISEDGAVSGLVSLMVDSTAQKLLDKMEKERLIEHLHLARLGTIGELVTEITHELNQPVCAISNYSEAGLRMLELGTGNTQDISEALAEINIQGDRAGKIISRLRNFARKPDPKLEAKSVRAIVDEAVHIALMDPLWENIKLDVDIDQDLPAVLADKLLVQQVILNLLRNAKEAIRQQRGLDGEISLTARRFSGQFIRIGVRDSAGMLSEEEIKEIFQPFYTTKAQGLGMGLAISKSIIDLHGGRLWAELDRKGNALFQFTLPIFQNELEREKA
jgi:PAS domain S-box-containing protein